MTKKNVVELTSDNATNYLHLSDRMVNIALGVTPDDKLSAEEYRFIADFQTACQSKGVNVQGDKEKNVSWMVRSYRWTRDLAIRVWDALVAAAKATFQAVGNLFKNLFGKSKQASVDACARVHNVAHDLYEEIDSKLTAMKQSA